MSSIQLRRYQTMPRPGTLCNKQFDVLMLIAERRLKSAGTAVSSADRYQAVLHEDILKLSECCGFS
jgi:hypothetical protein